MEEAGRQQVLSVSSRGGAAWRLGSVDLQAGCNTKLSIQGRHDPCIVPRAVPVVEADAAIAIYDLILENG